jgi:hypothetical protein
MPFGKDVFADKFFAEWSLSSAALGKAFAECLGHYANIQYPIVIETDFKISIKLGYWS